MQGLAIRLYYSAKESFWFLPALMALLAAGTAVGSVALDRELGDQWMRGLALVWSGGAEGARSVLSVIAGSTITVVSIVFSITITALAQTSSHFGPRVLRNFTRDRANQFVLGTFVAAFLFSLLVLRTVRTEADATFVPYLSVNIGILLAVLSIAVLIFFIHHIATSIQADLLIARIGEECRATVQALFPEALGAGASEPDPPIAAEPGAPGHTVACEAIGYVQGIDEDALLEAARQADALITVRARPGDFVSSGQSLADVEPAGARSGPLVRKVRGAFHIGDRRTPEQDLAYSVQQLVEIAARALSPGVNEPFTAILAIDHLGSVLRSLAGRGTPPPLRKDDGGKVRVVATALTFPDVVQLSVGMIRRHAVGTSDVSVALLRTMESLAPAVRRDRDRNALLAELRKLQRDALSIRNQTDRQRVLEHARRARAALCGTLAPEETGAAAEEIAQ